MQTKLSQLFTYNIRWRSRGLHSGSHRGAQSGLGSEFKGNLPLVDYPDARRIDINQTIRDLNDQIYARVFNQKNPTSIYAVCDLSASMQFEGNNHKLANAADITASIAYSANESGDTFGFVGFHQTIDKNWFIAPNKAIQKAVTFVEQLRKYDANISGSEGLLELPMHLGKKKSLIFLISDFHMPFALIEKALNRLSRHHVVPIVLWDKQEYEALPKFGFGTIIDPETGKQRTLFFRKSLHAKFLKLFNERKSKLETLLTKYEAPPCFVEETFKAEILSKYFQKFVSP